MTPARLPHLMTERLELRHLSLAAPTHALAFYARNREHLAPTSPALPEDFFTETFWERMVQQAAEEFLADRAVRMLGFLRQTDEVVVTINFTQIVRGPLQACYLGYNTDEAYQGRGLVTEGLEAAIAYVFRELNIHRVMANHLPENLASARVLEKLGFTVEGRARAYLRIAGSWRDHVLNAKLNPAWNATGM